VERNLSILIKVRMLDFSLWSHKVMSSAEIQPSISENPVIQRRLPKDPHNYLLDYFFVRNLLVIALILDESFPSSYEAI